MGIDHLLQGGVKSVDVKFRFFPIWTKQDHIVDPIFLDLLLIQTTGSVEHGNVIVLFVNMVCQRPRDADA